MYIMQQNNMPAVPSLLNAIQIANYLKRIGYNGDIRVDYNTLRQLHVGHSLNIPFENLDCILRKPVSLETTDLYHKIVVQKRGGYCFELNGLFGLLLKTLGFKVDNLMGRVCRGDFLARCHHLLIVEIDDKRWLVDVGFGGNGLIAPMPLEIEREERQYSETFRLAHNQEQGYILQHRLHNEYQNLYSFTLEESLFHDYIVANYYTSTSPNSFFTKFPICTKPTELGRITLMDSEFSQREHGETVMRNVLDSDDEYRGLLIRIFGIDISLSTSNE
jgi:N-hydroxyarylamine O-acetyltransferase